MRRQGRNDAVQSRAQHDYADLVSYLPTFRDSGNAFGLSPNASIPEIDLAWLKYCDYCFDRVDQIRGDPDLPVPIQQLNQLLAESVIEDHLGDGWLEENVVRPNTRQAAGYIDYDTTRVQRLLGLYRVQELARRLFQLQSFDWFPRMVAKLRTENLSGVGFELDVLWLLHLASVNVQARSEVGARGSDYDLSAIILDRRIPVEAKAKDDSTPFTAGTVTQTLKRAAQQMPKGQQGVIFLRIPYSWASRRT